MTFRPFILMIFILNFYSATAWCMIPEIKLPVWYKISPRVSYWNPQNGDLRLEINFQAVGNDVNDICVNVVFPKEFKSKSKEHRVAKLEAEKQWITEYFAIAPKNFKGWLDLQILARPDKNGMLKRVSEIATLSVSVRDIMINEVKKMETSIPIGYSLPIFLDEEIGICLPKEWIFSLHGPFDGKKLWLWVPNIVLGTGAISQTYESFKRSVRDCHIEEAREKLLGLQTKLNEFNQPFLVIKNEMGKEASITKTVVSTFLEANRLSLESLLNLEKAISEYDSKIHNFEVGFASGFLEANWSLMLEQVAPAEAEKRFRRALKVIPAWPGLVKIKSQKK